MTPEESARRFVDKLAWFVIVLSGLLLLAQGLEGLAVSRLPVDSSELALLRQFEAAAWLLDRAREIFWAGIAMTVVQLWIGVDLLRKKNWARLAAAWIIGGSLIPLIPMTLAWCFIAASGTLGTGSTVPLPIPATILGPLSIALAGLLLMATGIHLWMWRRLVSPPVRALFVKQRF